MEKETDLDELLKAVRKAYRDARKSLNETIDRRAKEHFNVFLLKLQGIDKPEYVPAFIKMEIRIHEKAVEKLKKLSVDYRKNQRRSRQLQQKTNPCQR